MTLALRSLLMGGLLIAIAGFSISHAPHSSAECAESYCTPEGGTSDEEFWSDPNTQLETNDPSGPAVFRGEAVPQDPVLIAVIAQPVQALRPAAEAYVEAVGIDVVVDAVNTVLDWIDPPDPPADPPEPPPDSQFINDANELNGQ